MLSISESGISSGSPGGFPPQEKRKLSVVSEMCPLPSAGLIAVASALLRSLSPGSSDAPQQGQLSSSHRNRSPQPWHCLVRFMPHPQQYIAPLLFP